MRSAPAGRIDSTPEQIELFAQSLGPQDRVALEVIAEGEQGADRLSRV